MAVRSGRSLRLMARRRKGRDIHGWVIVDKPAGIGSTDVVGKLRWAFQARKAGHAGTLDPAATGLLAVAFGEATKTIPAIADALKTYDFTMRFGSATSTDDAEGAPLAICAERPGDDAIRAALPHFTGEILQRPPQVSAVKIGGARAYDLARAGKVVEIAPRPLFVESLRMTGRADADHATFRMVCGKGGYVRSIARDLGERLGCLGHVLWLRRLATGPFDLDGAVTLDAVERLARTPDIDRLMRPLEHALGDLPRADLSPEAAKRIGHGNAAEVLCTDARPGDTVWAALDGRALAIGIYRDGAVHPGRVLYTGSVA